MGVLAVLPENARRVLLPEQSHLLETFAGQIALALERARLAELAEQSSLAAERETLRNTLLASISHDLRTPLAVMAGAGSTLAEHGASLDAGDARGAGALGRDQGARDVGAGVATCWIWCASSPGRWRCGATGRRSMTCVGSALAACGERLSGAPAGAATRAGAAAGVGRCHA